MRYTSDLTDAEWQLIDYCFPKPCQTGRPREPSQRELLNAIFYLTKTACQWRNLSTHFAPWGNVIAVSGRNRRASDILSLARPARSVHQQIRGLDPFAKKSNTRIPRQRREEIWGQEKWDVAASRQSAANQIILANECGGLPTRRYTGKGSEHINNLSPSETKSVRNSAES